MRRLLSLLRLKRRPRATAGAPARPVSRYGSWRQSGQDYSAASSDARNGWAMIDGRPTTPPAPWQRPSSRRGWATSRDQRSAPGLSLARSPDQAAPTGQPQASRRSVAGTGRTAPPAPAGASSTVGGSTSTTYPVRPAGPARRGAHGRARSQRQGSARAAVREEGNAGTAVRAASTSAAATPDRTATSPTVKAAVAAASGKAQSPAAVPWYERARSNRAAGHRHCGHLESILHRDWAAGEEPPQQIVQAVDRLAELPQLIKERLLTGLDAIYVGPGGVPDLDDMAALSGMPLPSGRATWDVCAGAYGERKVIVGSRPSPTPDVMCHEIGHALDDIDGTGEAWQSDSDEFGALYEQCLPWMDSDFHRQGGHLGSPRSRRASAPRWSRWWVAILVLR
jgi:hypothetical protein